MKKQEDTNEILIEFAKTLGLVLIPGKFDTELPPVTKNVMTFQEAEDSPFPAIHELAHALRVPLGQNLSTYLTHSPSDEHLWVYAMEKNIESLLNLNPSSIESLNEFAIEFSPQEFERFLSSIFPQGTRNPFKNLHTSNPIQEWNEILNPYLQETQKQLSFFLEKLRFDEQGLVVFR